MLWVGDNAISPGELPALIGDTGAMVSLKPLMMRRLPKLWGVDTPCEARTRCFRPLATGVLLDDFPQAVKLTLANNAITEARMHFFKRQAPNDMKKEDLVAKWWIITDRRDAIALNPSNQNWDFPPLLPNHWLRTACAR